MNSYPNLPIRSPRPDARRCIDVLAGADRPPLVEYLVDDVVMRPIVTDLLGRTWVSEAADPVPGSDKERAWADRHAGLIRSWEDFERYPQNPHRLPGYRDRRRRNQGAASLTIPPAEGRDSPG